MHNALALLLASVFVVAAAHPSNAQQRRKASEANADAVWSPGTYSFPGSTMAYRSPTGVAVVAPIVPPPSEPAPPETRPTQPQTPQPMTQICWFEGGGTHCYGPYVWSTENMQSTEHVRYFNDFFEAAEAYRAQGSQIPYVAN